MNDSLRFSENTATILGLVDNITSRQTGRGGDVFEVDVICGRSYYDKQEKRQVQKDSLIRAVCFGESAQVARQLRKGDVVLVRGRLEGKHQQKSKGPGTWYSLDFVASLVVPVSIPRGAPSGSGSPPQVPGDDEVPF